MQFCFIQKTDEGNSLYVKIYVDILPIPNKTNTLRETDSIE